MNIPWSFFSSLFSTCGPWAKSGPWKNFDGLQFGFSLYSKVWEFTELLQMLFRTFPAAESSQFPQALSECDLLQPMYIRLKKCDCENSCPVSTDLLTCEQEKKNRAAGTWVWMETLREGGWDGLDLPPPGGKAQKTECESHSCWSERLHPLSL